MVNSNGSITTANVIGLHHKGKEYNLPSYNREEKRNMSPVETKKYWIKSIESGEIQGYNTVKAAEKAAKEEHKYME